MIPLGIKGDIRHIGFDDGFFSRGDKNTVVVGTVVRGDQLIEGFLTGKIEVDGEDATETLSNLVCNSRFHDTLRVIFLKGITMAGFNVIDIHELHSETGLPVIVVLRKKPDMNRINKALQKTEDPVHKWQLIKKAGPLYEMDRPRGKLFFQKAGVDKASAQEFISLSIRTGNLPEGVRVSHLVASAVTLGESRRRP